MPKIHYFPRYSQRENMVTNNTMLLFSRLYNNDTGKFNKFINLILEEYNIEQLDTEIKFHQQVRGQGSVPDAIIEQKSFKIIIETKLYGQENIRQIKKHCDSFGNEDRQLLLWINKDPIDERYYQEIIDLLNEINEEREKNISFVPTTFKDICRCFNEILYEYDFEMKELIDDYESFCNETGLIDNADTKMRVVLSGKTYQQNISNNIYYAPSDRGYQNYKYLGLYKKKAVRAIGEVICSADVFYDEKKDIIHIEEIQIGNLTEEQKETIKKVIIEAKGKFGYLISKGHRFFFVQKFFETEYIKPTKGGLMGQRYFDLSMIEGYSREMTAEEIANLLRGKSWIS